MQKDTIVAIATALSESGIGIIRISGEDAIVIADKIFMGKRDFIRFQEKKDVCHKDFSLEKAKTHTIHYGYIVDGNIVIDEVLVSVMRKPNSYTAENVVEINCHGGILVLKKVLELTVKNGARIAEPGEFTKQAFLNGRIDLSEAEAVIDLIQSKNDFALYSSVKQLKGSVSEIIKELRDRIIYEAAFIESALDDPENYSTDGYGKKLFGIVENIINRINGLIKYADDGRMLREGIRTVIVGKPNAGKSSFLNEILGEERAIVTDIAGTTRDILEEDIRLGQVSLHLVDTAGIRNTEDTVEKIGVERAKKYAADADLILYIVDSSMPLDQNDEEILNLIKEERKKFVVLLNKTDLEMSVTEEKIEAFIKKKLYGFSDYEIIKISALHHEGLDDFKNTVQEMFFSRDISFNDEVIITSMRHKEALLEAVESLRMVENSIESSLSEDFYSVDLMNAYAALGKIIGEQVDDDLVNEIFSKFCMGK